MATKQIAVDKQQLMEFYRQMALIRRFEDMCAEKYAEGKIGGFLHLYVGEEAVAVGAFSALEPRDLIMTHYRDHGHAIARGVDTKRMMAELLGKSTGTSKGKGGSMHIFDASKGFLGGYAIVAAMLPMAVGLAMGSKFKKDGAITVCIFGDGAVQEGEYHEAMTLASLWNLPVLFLLENNGYGMGVSLENSFPIKDLYKTAAPYNVEASQVDGMDVETMRAGMLKAVEYVRSGKGPYLLEAQCYRFKGHSMADPMSYRTRAEEEFWKKKDPIASFKRRLIAANLATEEDIQKIEAAVEQEVLDAAKFAEESPAPDLKELYSDIYAE